MLGKSRASLCPDQFFRVLGIHVYRRPLPSRRFLGDIGVSREHRPIDQSIVVAFDAAQGKAK